MRDRLCLFSGEAFTFEHDREFVGFAFRELVDLAAFGGDLGGVELLFCLACEVGAAAHRDRARDRLGQAGDDDQRAGGMGGGHPGDDPERDEQAVLGAEHELADPREPPDPRGLTKGMLLDVPLRLDAGSGLLDGSCVVVSRGGAPATPGRVGGSRRSSMRLVPGQSFRSRSVEAASVAWCGVASSSSVRLCG